MYFGSQPLSTYQDILSRLFPYKHQINRLLWSGSNSVTFYKHSHCCLNLPLFTCSNRNIKFITSCAIIFITLLRITFNIFWINLQVRPLASRMFISPGLLQPDCNYNSPGPKCFNGLNDIGSILWVLQYRLAWRSMFDYIFSNLYTHVLKVLSGCIKLHNYVVRFRALLCPHSYIYQANI